MKYISNGSFGEYSVINQKVDLDNIHSFCILKTQSDDIVNKLQSDNYVLNMAFFNEEKHRLEDKAFEMYCKTNPLPEITEPIYSSYTEIVDEEGNTIKQGSGDIILGIEDLKINRRYEIILNKILPTLEIELTNDNFSKFFTEKEKSEFQVLKEQFENEVKTRKDLENKLAEEKQYRESLEEAVAELSVQLSSVE